MKNKKITKSGFKTTLKTSFSTGSIRTGLVSNGFELEPIDLAMITEIFFKEPNPHYVPLYSFASSNLVFLSSDLKKMMLKILSDL